MRISGDSGAIHVQFFEIESPKKPMFRRDGQLRAEHSQAISQLADWQGWLASPENRLAFNEYYRLPRRGALPVQFHLALIYGRRAEVEANKRGRNQREYERQSVSMMTFDRLRPLYDARNDFTVKLLRGRLIAIAAQPTFELSTAVASDVVALEEKERAIAECSLLTRKRRDWLTEALPRVEAWLASPGVHILSFLEGQTLRAIR
jgi:hypothetical protein